MAKNLDTINALPSADTFDNFILKTNAAINFIRDEAVSVNASANGANVTGNGSVYGTFAANVLVSIENFRGGNVTTANTLNIGSNVLIGTGNTLSIGNSTVNTFSNSSHLRVSNLQAVSQFVNAISGGVFGTPTALNIISNTVFATTTNIILGNFFTNSSVLMMGTELLVNSDHISIGNSTVNAIVNSTVLSYGNVAINRTNMSIGNSTVNTSINSISFISGIITANQTGINVGSNVSLSTTGLTVGNSTVNLSVNSSTFKLNEVPTLQKVLYTSSNTDIQNVNSFLLANYRSAEYLISIDNTNGYQLSKILMIHDGTTAYITEYGIITSNGSLGTFAATTNATHALLRFTPAYASTTNLRFVQTFIEV